MPPLSSTTRLEWIDVLRGYGIVFVVLGHALLGLISANVIDAQGWSKDAVLFLYLFHMPIIFFVSGYVSRDASKPLGSFLTALFKWIVAPYFIWSVILVLIQNAVPSGANNPIPFHALMMILWAPISICWFLYALFLIKISDYGACKVFRNGTKVALSLAVLGIIGYTLCEQLIPAHNLSRNTFGSLFFYSIARIGAEKKDAFETLMKSFDKNKFLALGAKIICIAGLAMTTYFYAKSPSIHSISSFQSLLLLTGTAGTFLFLLVARQGKGSMVSAVFKQFGLYSMVIYVQHPIWGAGIRSLLLRAHIASPLTLLVLIVGGGLVLPMIGQKILDHYRLTPLLGIRPVTSPKRNNPALR